jgi:hypothetical protein
MYKIEIDIAEWDFGVETVTIETKDFDKIAIIQEFIEFQQLHGWCVDYDAIEFVDEELSEVEIGEIAKDEDGVVWQRVA